MTRKKQKCILLPRKSLEQGRKRNGFCYKINKDVHFITKSLKTTKKMEFFIIQTITRKNKNEFYKNKNIMTRKTHGNSLNITKKASKQGNKWRCGNKGCKPYVVIHIDEV